MNLRNGIELLVLILKIVLFIMSLQWRVRTPAATGGACVPSVVF